MRNLCIAALYLLAAACSSGGAGTAARDVPDAGDLAPLDRLPDRDALRDAARDPDAGRDLCDLPDAGDLDLAPEPDSGALCQPGDGCFLDPCTLNADCQSGWCVEHLGGLVCTDICQEECPAGFNCQLVQGTYPDVVFICVSSFASLCRPCMSAADCISPSGGAAVCLLFGDAQGSFCGGPCKADSDCPDGYLCQSATTVDGIASFQCLPADGECKCTPRSVSLALATNCRQVNELGTCPGKRACTENGLTPCDASLPAAETCDGLDDNCDGQTDEVPCDDGNGCTQDACAGAAGCQFTPLDEVECMDGNPCTAADRCQSGVCAGDPVECEDQDPCTDDLCTPTGGCDHPFNSAACDDGDPCTVADACSEGACAGVSVNCDCQTDQDCDALDDGDLCNGTLACNTGKWPFHCEVAAGSVVQCPDPQGLDAPCLLSSCLPETGECTALPFHDGFPCDDQDPCTAVDLCGQGKCKGMGTLNCQDGNPCTDDACDPIDGCVYTFNWLPCQDGDACTASDVCQEGQCQPGKPLLCEDDNPCTNDVCNPLYGCMWTPAYGPCDDGNACTTDDHCAAGSCVSSGLLPCDDSNPCTTDSCVPQSGCLSVLNADPCDDSNPCTTGDHCSLGACTGGPSLSCNDANPCTNDSCNPSKGCVHAANQNPCDDGSACTDKDTCQAGQCVGKTVHDCDDQNPCTKDTCTPGGGCGHAPAPGPCDDGDPCSVNDACQQGLCQPGPAVACNDGNPCTADSCNQDGLCEHAAADAPCDDDNACTTGDHCAAGACAFDDLVSCDDDNVCTTDACHPLQGCLHKPNTLPCDDGNLCTANDKCGNNACVPGTPLVCIDGNPCTDDACSPGSGCTYSPVAGPCNDGNACTTGDACDDGLCMGTATLDCDDDDDCTADSCLPAAGCQHDPTTPCCGNGMEEPPEECDDGNDLDGDLCRPGCILPTCKDAVRNGLETDIDCGGTCPPCPDGLLCKLASDCASLVCKDGACAAPACTDGIKNGLETDVDCGGNACPGCADGKACLSHADCQTGALCFNNKCDVYGSGLDGDLTVNGTTTVNTVAAPVNATAASSTANLSSAQGFAAGQVVLLHQSQGANAGQWETALVKTVAGNQLTFSSPLSKTYVTDGGTNRAQALVVPQYHHVTITGGGTLTAPAWNGSTGGILALQATGDFALQNGTVSMDGKGYRGTGHGCTRRCTDGVAGESPSGPGPQGVAKNGMGGGGGEQGQDCGAGGGGGYGTAGQPGHVGGCGACAKNCPIQGGQPGDAGGSPDTGALVLFGGAGGEGGADEDGSYPGAGGNGGGLIIIKARKVVLSAKLVVRGGAGATGNQNSCGGGSGMGGGGGGAGGGVYLLSDEAALGNAQIVAAGATGGGCAGGGDGYNGGTGGDGRIAVRAKSVSGTTAPAYTPLPF